MTPIIMKFGGSSVADAACIRQVATSARTALADINVEMISIGANEINLSPVVKRENEHDALRRLQAALMTEEVA